VSELPKGWVKLNMDQLAADVPYATAIGPFGSSLRASDYREDGVPLVFVRNIRSQIFGSQGDRFVSESKAVELSPHTVRPGDLLVTKMGDPPGDTTVYPEGRPEAIITSDCIKLTPGPLTTSAFLQRWLITDNLRARLLEEVRGVAQQKISLERFRSMQVELPPVAEQRRIVSKLDDLLGRSKRAKEELAAIPALLERYRQSVLAAAFRGDLTADWRAKNPEAEPASELLKRIRVERRRRWEEVELARLTAKGKAPTDEKWRSDYTEGAAPVWQGVMDVPAEWSTASLEALTDASRTIRYGILMPGPDRPDGIPYIKVKNIRGDRVILDQIQRTTPEIHRQYLAAQLALGDLVVSIRGTYGRVAPVPPELVGGNVTQDSARVAPLSHVDRDWLAWMLRSPQIQAHWEAVAKGVAVQGVNISDLRPTGLPVCSLLEQREIVRRIDAALARIDALRQVVDAQLASVDALDRSSLTRAFRGELVPQDPNDEPAAVLLDRIRAERAAAPVKKPGRKPRSPNP